MPTVLLLKELFTFLSYVATGVVHIETESPHEQQGQFTGRPERDWDRRASSGVAAMRGPSAPQGASRRFGTPRHGGVPIGAAPGEPRPPSEAEIVTQVLVLDDTQMQVSAFAGICFYELKH